MKKKISKTLLLSAITGLSIIAANSASANSINGVHNDIFCKPSKPTKDRLKLYNCDTTTYPLYPLAPSVPNVNPNPGPGPDPGPPYTS